MKKLRRLSVRLALLSAMLLVAQTGYLGATPRAYASSQLIASAAIGAPAASGQYVFWIEMINSRNTIKMHDLSTGQTRSVTDSDLHINSLATDGQSLVWVEGADTGDRIMRYNIAANQISVLLPENKNMTQGLTLDNGILYYTWLDDSRSGLYRRSLQTGEEQLISSVGKNPVASDGKLLWVEQTQPACYDKILNDVDPNTGTSQLCPPIWHLHLYNNGSDKLLASSTEEIQFAFSGYHVSGDRVVWSQHSDKAYKYDITTDKIEAISSSAATDPLISGNTVVWTVLPSKAIDAPDVSSIEITDLAGSEAPKAVIANSTAVVRAWAIVQQNTLVFTVSPNKMSDAQELRTTSLSTRNLTFDAIPQSEPLDCGNPLTCGQPYRVGEYLYEGSGGNQRWWTVNGVQFFLPNQGINHKTFIHDTYFNNLSTIDYWLDRAVLDRVKTLRIFIMMAGDQNYPNETSSIDAIYDFAARAYYKDMRIGIVLHNSWDLSLNHTKATYLTNLINRFRNLGHSPLIAYVSASNEINNWCEGPVYGSQRQHGDCFDSVCNTGGSCDGFDGAKRRLYVDDANRWVNWVKAMMDMLDPSILVTVGVSTEMRDRDGQNSAWTFWKRTGQYGPIFYHTDFFSPHDYSGQGIARYWEIRAIFGASTPPVVLEEYGHPTDPWANTPDRRHFKEGCWNPDNPNDPWVPCPQQGPVYQHIRPSASSLVEDNIRAIRHAGGVRYAGGAAFMLADGSAGYRICNVTNSGYFTGLHWNDPYNTNYCTGTYSNYTNAYHKTKATGHRVLVHHCVHPYRICGFADIKP